MTAPRDEPDSEEECQKPCDPDSGCPNCASYWDRMAYEGYWNKDQHRWTEKGWREMTK